MCPGVFFHFFKILIFCVRCVKGRKMVQNDKKIWLSHSKSQEPQIISLSFMVHICKIIISPGFCFCFSFFQFFKILNFWVISGVKGQKQSQMTKHFVSRAPYLRDHPYDFHIWCLCVKMIISPGVFRLFQNFDFLGCQVGERVKSGPI